MRIGIREMIFFLLLLAMPVSAYLFVFQPRNAQISEARDEINKKQAKLEQLEAATQSVDDLGVEIDRLAEAIELFEHKLPAQREVEVILKQVWQLAAKRSLIPKSIKTDKPITENQYAELPIQIQLVGDFDGFYSFLLDLEKLQRITRIPQMKLKKSTKEGNRGQMFANLTLSIFFEGDDQSRGRERT